MQTYMERATQVACDSQIAVQVLLSLGNDDIAFVPLKPVSGEYLTREEFTVRQFRSVGIVGLRGLESCSAFKEPLDPPVVDAIAAAFLEYVRVLLGQSFAAQVEAAEVAELERLYLLPSVRAF